MSDVALQLIAENKKTRVTFLDLGNCGLTEIPAEIGELVWLESVSLASEWHEWDGENWQERKSQNTGDKNEGLIDLAPLAGLDQSANALLSRARRSPTSHRWPASPICKR